MLGYNSLARATKPCIMTPTVYFTGNGEARKIDLTGNFDTTSLWGQTLDANCTWMTWQQFVYQHPAKKVNQIGSVLNRVVHADEPSPEADKLFRWVQAIQEKDWFNGYNYPGDLVNALTEWLKGLLVEAQTQ